MKTFHENPSCKVCNSRHTVKDGKIKGVQRWECRFCGKKFLDNDAQPGMKTPAIQVSSALRMYYEGVSLNSICRQLQQEHNNYPSDSTVYKWVNIYTHKVLTAANNYHPEVGETWIADETVLKICGQQVWIWDIIDKDTCFLLATQLSLNHEKKDAQLLIEKAIKKAGKTPEVVIADKLAIYLEGTDLTSVADSGYKLKCTSTGDDEISGRIKHFHDTLQRRTNLMADLKSMDRVIEFTNGWLIHYNYFRPHEYHGGMTPAEVANIEYPH
jgi:putative transposase